MNKTHRIVWSESRQSFVVTHEKAATRGKPSSVRKAVAHTAVAAAMAAMGVGMAQATTNTVSTVQTNAYNLSNGESLVVESNGSIVTSSSSGVYVTGTAGFISNSGTIRGGAAGIGQSSSTLSGGLTNSGSISGLSGISQYNSTLSGGLTNSGTISGGNSGIYQYNSTLTDGLINSGAISGGTYGIFQNNSTLSGGLTNSGTIAATGTNTGTVVGSTGTVTGQFAIAVDSTSSLDRVVIAGNDTARFQGIVFADRTPMSIASGATYTLRSTDDFRVASFTNNGTAQFDSTTPSFSVANVGDQTFNNAGTLKVADGQSATLTGNYVQSGVLSVGASSASSYGKLTVTGNATLNSGASFNVDVASSNTLASGNTLIGVLTVGGTLTNNAGTLAVTDNSTLVDFVASKNGNAVDLAVVAQQTVGGSSSETPSSGAPSSGGSSSGGTTTITNSQTSTYVLSNNENLVVARSGSIVTSSNYGVYANVNGGFIDNSGTIIAGGQSGIGLYQSTLSGGLTNSGTIGGRYYGISQTSSTLASGLTNSGTIGGATSGIYLFRSTLDGGLTNSGTIGGGNYGIYLKSNSTLDGGLTNSGTIGGGAYGIYLASNSTLRGGLTNSGTIAATGTNTGTVVGSTGMVTGQFAIAVDSTSSLDSIVIAGNDTARFQGIVFADATPMSIASGATYTLRSTDDFRVASFTNNGTAQFDSTTPNFSVAHVGDGTFNNAGILKVADGQSATLTGNYVQSGVLSVGASSASSYGKLNVTGDATLNSGASFNVDVASSNTLVSGNTLTGVLTAAGTLTNNAGTLAVTDNSTLVNFVANQNGNAVDLAVVAQPASSGTSSGGSSSGSSTTSTAFTTYVRESGTTGALSAAATLDKLLSRWLKDGTTGNTGMDKALTDLIAHSSSTKAQVVEAVKETLPLLTGATIAAASSALNSINRVIQARKDSKRGMSSGDSFFTDSHLWFKPFASWADQADKSGVSGYKSNLAGAAFGGDATIGDNDRLGATVAYASADVKSNDANQRAKVDVYQLIGYGSHSIDANTELTYQADIGSNVNRGRRNIAFMGTTATSNYRSTSFHLGAGIGRTYQLSEATSVTPSLRTDYTHVRDGSYSENGAGAMNLNVNARSTEEMLWSADVKLAHKLKDSLTLVANGGLAYDSKAKAASVTAAYAGAPGMGFTTTGIKPDATTFRGGLGLVSTPENGPEITGRYDVERRNGYTNQTVSAKARWVF